MCSASMVPLLSPRKHLRTWHDILLTQALVCRRCLGGGSGEPPVLFSLLVSICKLYAAGSLQILLRILLLRFHPQPEMCILRLD